MRDALPAKVRRRYETGIVNLDLNEGGGTHWCSYAKDHSKALYFDSFGNLRPPRELVKYLTSSGPCTIHYNHDRFQNFNAYNCGHLVLHFLSINSPPLTTF